MDINFLRIAITLVTMSAFFGIVWWAYAPSRKRQWEQRGALDKDDA